MHNTNPNAKYKSGKYIYQFVIDRLKVSRKTKKYVLGKKLNKRKLNNLLSSVEVGKDAKTMYELPEIKPYLFCPHCGCTASRTTNNMTVYPEAYYLEYCLRCNAVVSYIDNSPYIHILEYLNKETNQIEHWSY